MNPKKAKSVIKDLHHELDLNENLVNDIIDFYWLHVRKTIVTAAYPRINIENLGIFQVKYKALDKTITKYENAINKLGTENFHKYAKYDNMKSRVDILLKLKEDMQTEKERKYQIKSNKYGNTTGSLEEKGKDS